MVDLKLLTEKLSLTGSEKMADFSIDLEKAFLLNEGITYFGLQTLFKFDYITPSPVTISNVSFGIYEWQATINRFCDSLIQN